MKNSNFKLISILVLFLLASIFLIQNTQVVDINVLIWSFSMSASIIVVSMLVIGILIGWGLKSYVNYKGKKPNKPNEEN